VRVWLDAAGDLDPLPEQQSHQITISAQADGLVRIPSGTGNAAAGSTVSYLPLREH
jgi:molybdopterin biosynthesis enzyme